MDTRQLGRLMEGFVFGVCFGVASIRIDHQEYAAAALTLAIAALFALVTGLYWMRLEGVQD